MTFAIFEDARMIYSHMKSNAGFFCGSEGTERWRAVVAVKGWEVEGLNVSGVACGKYGRRQHGGRAWAKGWWQGIQAGMMGTAKGFRSLAGVAGTM